MTAEQFQMHPGMTPEERQKVREFRRSWRAEEDARAKKHAAEHPLSPEERVALTKTLSTIPGFAPPSLSNDRCPVCTHHMNWVDGYGYICSKRGGCGSEFEIEEQS